MPLLSTSFIREYKVRLGVVVVLASLALLVFGGVGAINVGEGIYQEVLFKGVDWALASYGYNLQVNQVDWVY